MVTVREKLKAEIIRCAKDPAYFIRKYVRIKHPKRGLIPFDMYDYQSSLLEDYRSNRFNIVLKARQLGISELTAAYAVWLMLFYRDKNILVLAIKAATAKNIIRKVRTALKKLPRWLLLSDITVDNVMSIELSNGSVIKAVAASPDAGRSEALSLLIIDEAAFVKNMEEIWTGILPTVQVGGRCIVISTPHGVGNLFHRLYTEAEEGLNEFKATKLLWWVHPDHIADLADDPDRPGFKTSPWFRAEIKRTNMSARDIAQELEANFNASGDTVIDPISLEHLRKTIQQPPEKRYLDRCLYVWQQPVENKKYFITADVARGDGKDGSAFHVWEPESMTQIAEYSGKLNTDDFAQLLVDTGRLYNTALLVVENNNVGLACLTHIKAIGYPNLYYSRKGDDKPGAIVDTAFGPMEQDLVIGFTTSPKNRTLMISKFEENVRKRTVSLRSARLYDELKTFIWNNGRAEAQSGKNDDLTMACAIGTWIRDTFLLSSYASVETQKAMLGAYSVSRTNNTQIPGACKDPHVVPMRAAASSFRPPPLNHVRLPNGGFVDVSWVIGKG